MGAKFVPITIPRLCRCFEMSIWNNVLVLKNDRLISFIASLTDMLGYKLLKSIEDIKNSIFQHLAVLRLSVKILSNLE